MKKKMTLVMALLLILSMVMVGCGDKKQTAEELFNATMESSAEMTSYTFDFEGNIEFELPEGAEADPMVSMIGNSVSLSGTGEMDSKEMLGYMALDFSLQGFGLNSELYFSKEEMLFKNPMTGQFMRMNYAQLAEMNGEQAFNIEEINKMYDTQALTKEFVAFVDTKGLSLMELLNVSDKVESESVEVNGAKVDTQILTMNLNKETLKELIPLYMEFYLEVQMPKMQEALGEDGMVEDFDPAELQTAMDEMFQVMDINAMTVKMYIDENNMIVKEGVNFDVKITEPETSQSFALQGDFVMNMYEINSTIVRTSADVDPAMIMDFSDMMPEMEYDETYDMDVME